MPRPLPDGLYEHVVTHGLGEAIEALGAHRKHALGELDPADAAGVLARHVAQEVERVLAELPAADRAEKQVALANRVLDVLRDEGSEGRSGVQEEHVREARQLRVVFAAAEPRRPTTPLASSTLLTRNRAEPSLKASWRARSRRRIASMC